MGIFHPVHTAVRPRYAICTPLAQVPPQRFSPGWATGSEVQFAFWHQLCDLWQVLRVSVPEFLCHVEEGDKNLGTSEG